MKAVAGSHLFGLNSETSDKDFKGIYIPSTEEILLGNDSGTITQTTGNSISRNTKDDVDIQLFSIKKFMKMLSNGDTTALELIFTPQEMIIQESEEWKELREESKKLISKQLNALLGYMRHQVNRYGVRGSRLNDLEATIDILSELEKLHHSKFKLKLAWDDIVEKVKPLTHVKIIELTNSSGLVPGIDILGKKFDYHVSFEVILKNLKTQWKEYGQRAREAKKNRGIDWKALSHSLRCCIQGIELFETGNITLPHSGENRELLIKIKQGRIEFSEFQIILDDLLERIELAAKYSSLPEKFDDSEYDNIVLKYYKKKVLDSI